MSDDISRWERQRADLQKMLDDFQSARAQETISDQIALLQAQLCDIERHIAALKKRRS